MTSKALVASLACLVVVSLSLEASAMPVAVSGGVRFTFDAPGAQQVYLAGAFNGWAPTRDHLTKAEGGKWEITVPLKPGRYEYKFVIDGKTWKEDPENPLSVPDPYGGKNSVLVVRDDGSLDFEGKSLGGGAPVVASLPGLTKPLYLAILWHQHQPRYFKDPKTGEYLDPWVRIHGIKDYYDMVATLANYPRMKFTVNLTPVLLAQLEEMTTAWSRYAPVAGRRPGYMPGLDMWVRLTLTPAESLAYDEKAFILRNFFRMPRETMIDPYPRFKELAGKDKGDSDEAIRETVAAFTDADWRDLQAWFNLAEFDPDFKEGQVVLPDGQRVSVAPLVAKGRDFTEADKAEIIAVQFEILRNIIPVHKSFQDRGQIEVITSPFYHPILPLLCDTDIGLAADPGIALPQKRFAYPEDAAAQVEMACDTYQRLFGRKPRGMWPSEGSVSEAILPIVSAAGIAWLASDEGVLAKSLGAASLEPKQKYKCYVAGTGDGRVGLVFRDHKISDDIGSRYSKLSGVEAANDLVKKLYNIHKSIQSLDGDYVVPIILDGENAWENFPRDGKDFLNSFYSQVSQAPWLRPVTMSEAFDQITPMPLAHLAPGSWIAPNFDTWIGESEENTAWTYLAAAREAIATRALTLSGETKQAVMTEAYAAEGSDWFWWYGSDQNSGNDEAFDAAFRGTLTNIYKLLGIMPPQYLLVPIVAPGACRPDVAMTGMLSPDISDSVGVPQAWEQAAYIADTPATGSVAGSEDMLKALYYGYDTQNLWLRIDTGISLEKLGARNCEISVYFSGKNDLLAQAFVQAQPGGPAHAFGFGITSKLDISVDPQGVSALFSKADGEGGWIRQTSLSIEAKKFFDIAVPFALLELSTGDELKFGVVGYCGGDIQDLLPDEGYVALRVPPLGGISYIRTLQDPRDDDYGPGSYVYPSDPVFIDGVFDLTSLEVMLDADDNVIFKARVLADLTSPWGGCTGYSLQAIDIYIDTDGVPNSGQRDLFPGRNARTAPENAWEYFVRASMDTVAMYDKNGTLLDAKVISYADGATSSIIVKFPRGAVGPSDKWNVIVAMLGHDGYSEGGIRPVKATRGQWVFGGCDREGLCPNIIDLVVDDGQSQEDILGSYRTTGKPVEIPGVKIRFP